jgi:hypothetical protein
MLEPLEYGAGIQSLQCKVLSLGQTDININVKIIQSKRVYEYKKGRTFSHKIYFLSLNSIVPLSYKIVYHFTI